MSASDSGQEPPSIGSPRLGAVGRGLLEKARRLEVPMGPRRSTELGGLVYVRGKGCNVWDVEGHRYVDLCAGFGALLLGHAHPAVNGALHAQQAKLGLALGDVFASDVKLMLLERLAELAPIDDALALLGSSGADAITAALKTAVLATGRAGVVAFDGSYHGLSYAPLSALGLRESYRAPFREQLGQHVTWVPYPDQEDALWHLEQALQSGRVGAVLLEPVLGRGGVRPLSSDLLGRIAAATRANGALLVADEIWTGLARSGAFAWSAQAGVVPDLLCLGKGLGGGLPLSACIGSRSLMAAWQREPEVVHTSTHAGNPLCCAAALATLGALESLGLERRSSELGAWFRELLARRLQGLPVEVRGVGLMLGIELLGRPGAASRAMAALLERGYIVSTGGGARDTVVLTPPLTVERALLEGFVEPLVQVLAGVLPS